uniref:HAD hydrolase-like protein n=1 Tax=Microbacterium sp. SORGH_AS_1204 TaxID=3041785 RepID=UPI0027D7A5FF|nr:HAD hydrolase-like protein [Microbacterium sp. SORGH_AS_1204]
MCSTCQATSDSRSAGCVGDRLDNDVISARHAGMRTAFIRRGPWGIIHSRRPEASLADHRPPPD